MLSTDKDDKMRLSKLNGFNAILIIFFLLLVVNVSAEITFFDSPDDYFIMGNSTTNATLTLWNQAGADEAITLTAGSNITVTANVTVIDVNGGDDIYSANATLYHSTSASDAADDENTHITNSSCALGPADGNTKVATCTFTMNYMALPGIWTVNVTAFDLSNTSASATDNNTVNSLAALEITQSTIDMGSLALGANSSSAATMTIRSQGNVQIDARLSGDVYTCTYGTIPVGNTRYSLDTGNYDSMATDLSADATTQTAFDLGVRGIATADGANSEKLEYWTILIPTSGVSGTCTNTLTVTAIAG
jgi:hypothetical protein